MVLRDHSARPTVVLRPLRLADEQEWHALRRTNHEHVQPWEPTLPPGAEVRDPISFRTFVRENDEEARSGRALPWSIEVEGRLAGQLHIFGITWGSNRSGAAGYWVSRTLVRRHIASRALALAIDHALGPAGLHRVEVNIRVDNERSLGVARVLGLRDEGIRERFLHIDGAWRDHQCFAVTSEDVGPEGLLGRLSHQ